MSANSPDHTLKSQYHAQVAADLESNAKEQERIATEVAALKAKLTALEQDHTLLTGMRQALASAEAQTGSSALGADSRAAEAAPVSRSVPRARAPKQSAHLPATTSTPAKAPAKSTRRVSRNNAPTLRDLVSDELSKQKEPRSAAEVTAALTQAHPQRKIGATVVRNTLEALVAKGQALRSKQQNSVFYSASGTAEPAATDSSADHAPATA